MSPRSDVVFTNTRSVFPASATVALPYGRLTTPSGSRMAVVEKPVLVNNPVPMKGRRPFSLVTTTRLMFATY